MCVRIREGAVGADDQITLAAVALGRYAAAIERARRDLWCTVRKLELHTLDGHLTTDELDRMITVAAATAMARTLTAQQELYAVIRGETT